MDALAGATPRRYPFELAGADGGPLRGEVRAAAGGSGRPAVVICHGFKGFRDWGFFPRLADRLALAGFSAVSFNFSGSGIGPDGETFSEPDRFGHATFSGDLRDLTTVVEALVAGSLAAGVDPPTRLGLFGHSRGGGVAVLFASTTPRIEALVTWAAVARPFRWEEETVARWRRDGRIEIRNMRTGEVLPLYTDVLDELDADRDGRLDPLAAASRLEIPWLVVHGEEDEAVPAAEGRELAARAGAGAELLLVPHAGHTLGARHPWAGSTPALDQAMDATVGWYVKNLFG